MTWTYKANLRGPRGPQGADGLAGVNAVANDTAAAGYISTTGVSATKTALNAFAAAREGVAATVEYKTTGTGVRYSVVRVHTHGKFIPGIVSKAFANDYETVGTTGINFKPVRENLDIAQVRYAAPVISSAGGWRESGNVDEVYGAQIKAGIVYHDMENAIRGSDSLGFFADGSSRIFSAHSLGETTATMVAAGVVNSFSYGPGVVRNGVALDLLADSFWATMFQTEISGRQILGQSETGDIILISVEGQTGVSGIAGNEVPALAIAEGCFNAIWLDGGGSSQTMVGGLYTQPSSDSARKRPAPEFLILNTRSASRPFDSGWVNLPLNAGFTANGEVPQFRQVGMSVEFRGQVKPTVGSFSASTVAVAQIPARFIASGSVKVFTGNGPAASFRKTLIQNTGSIEITGDVTDVAYIALHSLRYSLD